MGVRRFYFSLCDFIQRIPSRNINKHPYSRLSVELCTAAYLYHLTQLCQYYSCGQFFRHAHKRDCAICKSFSRRKFRLNIKKHLSYLLGSSNSLCILYNRLNRFSSRIIFPRGWFRSLTSRRRLSYPYLHRIHVHCPHILLLSG